MTHLKIQWKRVMVNMKNEKLEIVMIDPNKLKPYFRNPRNNDKTVEALIKIIPRVGFNVPIVVDKDLVIIKGHSRWNAARILELKEVPCIISSASDEQNNKDRILDNAIHELTEWDYDKLKIELDKTGVSLDGYNLKWIDKVIDTTTITTKHDTKTKDVEIVIPCPNCKKEIKYSKKELLKK